jgi:glycosyltransferase involved in cell wall biosynthesis
VSLHRTGRQVVVCTAVDLGPANAASIHIVELVRAFASAGYRTTLIAPRPNAGAMLHQIDGLAGVSLRLVPALRWLPLPNGARFILECVPAVVACWRERPELVYIRAGFLSFVLVSTIRAFGRGRVVSEHNGWLEDEARSLGHHRVATRLMRWSQLLDARAADMVRVVTPGIGRRLQENGLPQAKILAIGNGTNTAHFDAPPRDVALARFDLDPQLKYLGFIGNLVVWQGLCTALGAFHKLHSAHPSWRLLIAGDGPERPRLEAETAALGLAGKVRFLGPVDYAAAPLAISAFDIAIAPFSAKRNLSIGLSPLKIRDYASCGRPVIAADIPGIREFATAGWLVLHQPDNAMDLAATMALLMQDDARRHTMGATARLFALREFSWKRVIDTLTTSLNRGIDRPGHR